jgi:hypothetical protein
MYISLLALGIVLTAGGFVAIGFGVPINAFSLGNTLILSGTTAVIGGLILVGLATAVRQLNRIADALRDGQRAGRAAAPAEMPHLVPPTAHLTPVPPAPRAPKVQQKIPGFEPPEFRPQEFKPPEAKAPEPRNPEPEHKLPEALMQRRPAPQPPKSFMPKPPDRRPVEPRFPVAPGNDAPGPLDWLRKSRPPSNEQPVVEVPDEAPLSPRSPARPGLSPLGNVADSSFDPKPWERNRGDESQESRRAESGAAESRPGEARPQSRSSETRSSEVRPAEPKPSDFKFPEFRVTESGPPESHPVSRSEQIPRAKSPVERLRDEDQAQPQQKESFSFVWPDGKTRPASEAPPEPEAKSPVPQRTRPEPAAERNEEMPLGLSPGPAILKSGVIDGMAYTLYADGAIEAELPQGTVKFASVDALRAHLEKNG